MQYQASFLTGRYFLFHNITGGMVSVLVRPLLAMLLIVGLCSLGALAGTVTLIPQGATWRYLDNGSDQGTTWKNPGFSDASWKSGPAELGYGDGGESTLVSFGSDASQKFVTTYFRHTFNLSDPGSISALTLQILRDDGAVVYLNGVQVASYSMPSTFDYLTFANTAADYPWDPPIGLPISLLVAGENVFAVEIHQCNASSSDLSLNLILTAEQSLPGTAPAAPTLVSPADGSSAVGTPPTLTVQVSDPDEDSLTVQFLGRENVSNNPFTVVVLPDTQKYVASEAYAGIFTTQTQWIVANRSALNIVGVIHAGDIVDTYNNADQWARARTSLSLLDDVGLPYGLLPGNHDTPTTFYNQYFPYTRYALNNWYGGNYPAEKNDNNYILVSAGGVDLILLQLQFWPDDNTIAWANAVLKAYPERKAIITTHGFLGLDGSRSVHVMGSTEYIWQELVLPNPNVWFVLCGHVHGEFLRTDIANGHPVYQILADYQTLAEGGEGWLRIMRFVPSENRVEVQTFSPHLNAYQTDADSAFALELPMNGFKVLETCTAVSGATASHTWTEAVLDTEYQWAVRVTDPTGRTTASPAWTFNTVINDGTAPIISELAVTEITDDSAVVTWLTDEPADSWVSYNESPAVGSLTRLHHHSVQLDALSALTTYSLVVSSMDASGNAASDSREFTTLAPVDHPPTVPILTATAGDAIVDLSWTASIDPDGTPVTYEIWRRSGAETELALLADLDVLAYCDMNLENGMKYWYMIRACGDATGCTDSDSVSATPQAPDLNAYVIRNPTVIYGTVTGDYSALRPNVPGTQIISEQKIGLNGLLNLEYLLQTTASPAQINSLTLHLAATHDSWDDAWRMELWSSGDWLDITSDILISNGAYAVSNPASCVDATGAIRIRFTDSAAIRKEKLNSLAIELLYASITTGPIANLSPVAVDDTVSTPMDQSVVIDLLANDFDPNHDPLVLTVPTSTLNGATIAAPVDGAVNYTPPPGFTGPDTFNYSISDGEFSVTATVTIMVESESGGPALHVASVRLTASLAGKNWKATAAVTIVNQQDVPTGGVSVQGDWLFDNALIQTGVTALTDPAGLAILSSPPVKTSGGTFTFQVTNLQLSGATYDLAANVESEASMTVP